MINFEFIPKNTMFSFTTVATVMSEPELCYIDNTDCIVFSMRFYSCGGTEYQTAISPVTYDCVSHWVCKVRLVEDGPWCLRISNRAPSVGDVIEVTVHVLTNGHVWIEPWDGMSCDFINDVRFILAVYETDIYHHNQVRIDEICEEKKYLYPRSDESFVEVKPL